MKSLAEQYVCTVCGYNMAGYLPDNCPFCGATKDRFITSQECSARYGVVETPVFHICQVNNEA
ncbi:MAG: hypothetical protein OIN66_12175 [Candidatus Methanoperedens sp.]|nr:hypothetical protein [Candidatus Methanoperedens sp.]